MLFIVLLEAPRLVVAQMRKELLVFLVLWSLASFLAVAQFMGMELPNPTDLINNIFAAK
ncbi:MAG: hypothetical protein KGZ54_03615 [Dethiobacter sp.]|nr:hypothetical protein [Dethiobacter sp.]MBS3989177.1 hypothetical protein [Dethiobacter sp.]